MIARGLDGCITVWDGRYVFVGDVGDVIDTSTRAVVANLPALYDTRNMIEIDWTDGVVKAMNFR
jgi:DNA-binding beta-propeller fold protein YncE